MSTVAESARIARARPRKATRTGRRTTVGGGILWIVLFTVLLGGVVAVNVAVLRLNLELDRVGRERSQLRADVASIRSELSSVAATAEIERVAQLELGLEPANPDTTVYVTLRPR